MSSEIVVSETPNWLKELEEKREKRLKVRLGHEAGAGAPCLKCQDKCPGLDLHFWRKACKICRCPKEEHDVPDDDIYGWAQQQLLGSKPNKIKTKIVLNGKNEVELEWAPKGHQETVDNYLKTLPPETLPVKGSQAAQDRKQLLQKQIPFHDIDPTLCHDLNEEETKKMAEYIDHVKNSSVGVGQIVNLSNIIRANLHSISPQEAHIIASRYSQGIPFSEIVKHQSSLAQNLENLTLKNKKTQKNKSNLSKQHPQSVSITEQVVQNPLLETKYKDIVPPWYENESSKGSLPLPQYAKGFKPNKLSDNDNTEHPQKQQPNFLIDDKLLQGTNFDPTKTPSQFRGYHVPYKTQSEHYVIECAQETGENPLVYNVEPTNPNYAQNLPLGYKNAFQADKYGFENPFFDHGKGNKNPQYPYDIPVDQQANSTPKNIKDLMYSTYDPKSGPIPKTNASGDFNNDASELLPTNIILNTYKHTPGEATTENPKILNKEESVPWSGHFDVKGRPTDIQSDKYLQGKGREFPNSYYDPKTGKLISGVRPSEYPEISNVDPKSGKPVALTKQTHPGYFDPKTGRYIPDNRIRHVDPKTGQYIDPKTDKPAQTLNQEVYDPKSCANDPSNRMYYDPETGKPVQNLDQENYDPTVGIIDPKTGKYIATTDQLPPVYYDPKTGKYLHYNYGQSGLGPDYIDPQTGKPIVGHGHEPYDPNNPKGGFIDPKTGKFIPGHSYPPYFDPETGTIVPRQNIYDPNNSINPQTGKPIVGVGHESYDPNNPKGGFIDPKTGKLIPGHSYPVYFDPETGTYVPSHNICDPKGSIDPKTGRHLPGAGSYDPHGKPGYIDPETGKYIPFPDNYDVPSNVDPGSIDPKTGKPITGSGPYKPDNIPGLGHIDPKTGNFISGQGHQSPFKNKKLSQLKPGEINVSEDYLEPHMVNIGTIQDINPEIKGAKTAVNPGYESEDSDDGEYSPNTIKEILNNIMLPECHYCKKSFEENEFAVTIGRANILFHASCFKCAGCNQILADNIYFYDKESNNIYCGRDYAKIRGYPRCAACDELIFTKEYCLAENSTFHLKHFCCFQCDTPLAGQDYTLEDEKPYCLPCYETSKAAKCSTCMNVIKPDETGCQLNNVHFHAEDRCFACIVCRKPLMGKKLLLRNEKLFCSHDCFNTTK